MNIDLFLEEMEKSLNQMTQSSRGTRAKAIGDPNWSMECRVYNGSGKGPIRSYSPDQPYSSSSDGGEIKNNFVTSITVEADGMDTLSRDSCGNLQLIWRNLIYRSKKGSIFSSTPKCDRKVILDKQSGSICGGTITAIIGPSGAGKSTLLECLAGRRKKGLTGDIFVSVDTTARRSGSVKISLIGQRDEALHTLTVKEVLTFACKIKNYSRKGNIYTSGNLVDSVLKELTLTKCAETKVAKISGGQLKRLVFGVELVSGPDIILLDEPTSGLDASSAYSCVKLLKKLTDLRRNIYNKNSFKSPAIICSIHQPSARVLNNFDKIYVLSSDGRCIYQGLPSRLLTHLTKFNLLCPQFHNPADFIIEIASGDYGSDSINILAIDESERQLQELRSEKLITVGTGPIAVGMPKDRNIYMKVSKVIDSMKSQSFPLFGHTYLLWKRTIITNFREPKLTWFRLFQAVFVGLLMGFIYDYPIGEPDGCFPQTDQAASEFRSTEDNISFIFFITFFTVMASMMPTVLTFPSEVAILIQERNNGWYSCATYYFAKIIAELPFQIIVTLTFISIIYPMTGQVMEWHRCGYFALICLITASIAQCVGIMFGTYYVKSVENAVFLAPLSMAPAFLFSGFFGKLSALPLLLKPLAYTSYVRYSFEALLIVLYGMNRCSPAKSPSAQATGISSTRSHGAFDSGVPSHLLNTGYISGNEVDATMQLRRNLSKIGIYRYNPNPQSNFWDTSTVNPLSHLLNSPGQGNNYQLPGFSNLLNSQLSFGLNSSSSSGESLFPEGSYVLRRFEVSEDTFFVNLIILITFLLVLRVVCYVILLFKTNERK